MGTSLSNTVIIQRVVPHYRIPLFEKLYKDHGVLVACASKTPKETGLNISTASPPWLHQFDFNFPDPNDPFRAQVPTKEIIAELRPRLIISEFSMKMDSVRKLIIERKLGRIQRLLFWSHGWNMGRGFAGVKNKVSQYSRLLPYAFADGHITYSQEGASFINRFLPNMPTFVAKNTQEFIVNDEKLSRSLGLSAQPEQPFRILASGRMTSEKNFPLLIKLFKEMLISVPNARLTIIGDGPERNSVEAEAGSLLNSQVFLPGAIYEPERLATFFFDSDIAAYAGSVGLAVNHALAFGLPFLAFERGYRVPPFHHPEIAYIVPGKTGALVPNQDDAAFVRNLIAMARNRRHLLEMRKSTREYFVRNLSIDQYALGMSQALQYFGAAEKSYNKV